MASRSPARHHLEALRRFFGLCVAALAIFAMSQAWALFPATHPRLIWDDGETSLDLSLANQQQKLEGALERFRAARPELR